MKKITRTTFIMVAVLSVFLEIILKTTIAFAWGDNSESGKGRPSYTIEEINEGAIGATPQSDGEDYKNSPNYPGQIIFNTISDSTIGDEKNFVGAREVNLREDGRAESATPDTKWKGNDITVEDGKYYIIRLFVHNNNPNGYDAVAENTHVSFSIPGTSGTQVQVNGFIDSSNATPSEYWDYVNFNSPDSTPFHLEYLYGSALLENNGIGLGGLTLSDDVVKAKSGGVMIGYDALDGRVPGCYQYDNYVTVIVKAVFDTDFTVETKVRIADSGDKTWLDSADAKVGDKVEFRIGYRNTSDKQQDNVTIKDILPANLKYVEGTTVLKNSSYENGAVADHDYLVTTGTKIGSYGPDANAYIYFIAEVVDDDLEQGTNIVTNWAQAGVGDVTIQDSVEIRVRNDSKYHMILTIYGTIIAVCLLVIVITIWRIIKRNSQKQVGRRR